MANVKPDLVKRLAELVDGDGWEIADLLVEEFPPDEFGDGSKAHSGLYEALEVYEDALRRERGVILKASTMRRYRQTAIAWADGARAPSASFAAHQLLRGPNRHDRMQAYLKRNQGRPLSKRDVQRFRADDNPTPVKPWEQRARQRIRSTVKSLLLGGIITKRDDWWNAAGVDEARTVLVGMLRELADQMEGQS